MNSQPWWLYVILGIAALAVLRPLLMKPSAKDRAAVLAKIKAGAKVIDVRTPGEFAGGHYDGAKNIPLQEIQKRCKEIGGTDTAVVVYCQSGGRSAMAARALKAAGFTDVTNAGGIGDMPEKGS